MYDLLDRPLHWIEIKWPGLKPVENGGLSEPIENVIEVLVEIVDTDEIKRLFPRLSGADPEGEAPVLDDDVIFNRLVSDWRKVAARGQPVPFTAENVGLLLKAPLFGVGFATSYLSAVAGRGKIREGNSAGSPSGGRADDHQPATTTLSSASAERSE